MSDPVDKRAVVATTATAPAAVGGANVASSSPTAVPATAALVPTVSPMPQPTIVEAAEASEQDTATPPPMPTGEPPAQQVITGQTADGAFFLGAPEAPLTLIDYSDFL